MYVEQVQPLMPNDADHLACEGELIRRIFEKRIRTGIYFVIIKVLVQKIQAGGLRVGDKMYLMAFFCKAFSQLGGHYTTSSERRITNDPDFYLIHCYSFKSAGCPVESVVKRVEKVPGLLLSRDIFSKIATFVSFAIIKYCLIDYVLYPRTDIRLDKFVASIGKHPVR